MYSLFPSSTHEAQVNEYFKSIGGEHGLSNAVSDKSIIVCFTNRCGSTLLSSKLTELGIFGEPSDYKNFEFFNGDEVVDYCRRKNITSLVRYFESIKNNHQSELGYFSSKIGLDQLVWLTKINFFKNRIKNTKFIFSYREDVISQAISLLIALQSGKWTSNHGEVKTSVLKYDRNKIMEFVLMIKKSNALFEAFFSIHGIDPIRVSYEKMLEDENYLINLLDENNVEYKKGFSNKFNLNKQGSTLNEEWKSKFISELCDNIS
ncbi:TPA: hypothetical protein NG572_002163 [Vibrio parahaemolyticus]|nr:hypothetical protein [Vibrio parahaemolyticus]HCM1219921.1 hypothetical protein [Vibrio parahaemolyticus]